LDSLQIRVRETMSTHTDVDDWLTPGRFGTLLALLIFASHPDVVLGQATFFIRDFCQFGYPLAFHFRESFWRGEIPLWNPYSNCGLPFLAQWNTLVLYPGSLFYLLLPLSWALGVFCLLHQFLAGLGMYFLAHRWTANRLAAAVAGVAFAFNGFTLNSLMWPNYIATLGWLPWVVLTAEQAWQRGGRHVIAAALVGGVQMLCGAPELILLTWGFVGLLWLLTFVRGETRRPALFGRIFLAIALTICLAAAQLIPFLDLLLHSQREAGYAGAEWSLPGTGWANLLLPLYNCVKKSIGIYLQQYQGFTSSYYPGVGVLLLALLALWRRRYWRVPLLGALCLASLVLALGDNGFVYKWMRRAGVPLGIMRYPVKFIMLAAITLPLLAAEGASELFAPSRKDSRQNVWRLGIIWLTLVSCIGFLLWFAFYYPESPEPWLPVAQNGLLRVVLATLVVGALAAMVGTTDQLKRLVLTLAFLFLLWLDAATHMPRLNLTVSRSVYEPGLRPILEMRPALALGKSRAHISAPAWLKFNSIFVSDPFGTVLTSRLGLSADCNLLDAAPKTDGFFSLNLKEQIEALSVLTLIGDDVLTNLADFMSVGQVNTIVTHEEPGTNGQAKTRVQTFEWRPRPTALPMLTTGQKPLFVTQTEALQALKDPAFDFCSFVLLPREAASVVSASARIDARLLDSHVAAHRIDVTVESPAPTMVVVSQSDYHPWKVFVDGRPSRLWRANHAFQAFEVPAGRHRVKLVYIDHLFQLGIAVSLVTLGGCAVFWLRMRRHAYTTS
jgi:hypothetical protein